MKYITNFFGVGCVALLAMLILAPGAFAQQPTAPNPPDDLDADTGDTTSETADQHGRITLTWGPVLGDDNGGFAVTDYVIEVSSDYDASDPTAATWAVLNITETAPNDPTADDAKYSALHVLPTTVAGEEVTTHNEARYYRVKAVNVIGTGDPSTVATATTHDVPAPPTDLAARPGAADQATGDQFGRITITWNAVEVAEGDLPVTSYILEVTDDATDDDSWTASDGTLPGGGSIAVTSPTGTETQYSAVHDLSSLTPSHNLTRHYRVKSVNAASTAGGDPSDPRMATTYDVPGVPTGLTVKGVTVNENTETQNDITVSWNALEVAEGDLPITGYRVQFLTDATGADWTDVPGSSNVTHAAGTIEAAHEGLDENATDPVTYYYRVNAVNAAGSGDPTSVTAGVKLAPPAAPTELTATAVDKRESIDLSWTAPGNTGEPPVTGYKIERSADYDPTNVGGETWTELQANRPGRAYRDKGTDITGGFADGTRYYYRVSAINAVGASTASNIDGAISSNKALKPRNLTATLAADMMSIGLVWDGPVNDEDGNPANGGSPITGYKIEVSTDAGATWADVEDDKPEHRESELLTPGEITDFAYTHTPVASGTSYTYRVSAFNDAGAGEASDPSASVSTNAVAPGAPTLTATAATDALSVTLEWAKPADGGADITSWKIEVADDDASNPGTPDAATWADLDIAVTDPVAPATMYSAVHTGLNASATYHYRVSATNSVDTGAASTAVPATTLDIPGAPTGLTATADGGKHDQFVLDCAGR